MNLTIQKTQAKSAWITLVFLWLSGLALHAQPVETWCLLNNTNSVPAGSTLNINAPGLFPGVTQVQNKVIELGDNATLIIGTSFTMIDCYIKCGNNAVIIVQGDGTLFRSVRSNFFTCGQFLWQGIKMDPGSRMDFAGCGIYNARIGILFSPGYNNSTNILRGSRFDNNEIGIQAGTDLADGATVGFAISWGNTFNVSSQSLPGGIPIAGLVVTRNSNLAFGTSGIRNEFKNTLVGAWVRNGGHLTIANAAFREMRSVNTGVIASAYQKTGILCQQGSLSVTKGVNGGNCEFYSEKYNIRAIQPTGLLSVQHAFFDNTLYIPSHSGLAQVVTAIFINNATVPVNISIEKNRFEGPHRGIYCERPPGNSFATNTTISNNVYLSSNRFLEVKGIYDATNNFWILGNRVESNQTSGYPANAIFISGTGNNYLVSSNYIYRYGTAAALQGLINGSEVQSFAIAFENMNGIGNEIVYNTVESNINPALGAAYTSQSYHSFVKCGIHVFNCPGVNVCSNETNDTYRGFHFAGNCINSKFGYNKMKRHVFGVLAQSDANAGTDLGDQVRTENEWFGAGSYINGGVAAYNPESSVLFNIIVNDALPPYYPPTFSPLIGWIKVEAGDVNPCEFRSTNFSEDDENIAKDLYPFKDVINRWDMRSYLIDKVMCYQGSNVPSINNFFNSAAVTSEFAYAGAFRRFHDAFAANNIHAAQLSNQTSQFIDKHAQFIALWESLALDTLNPDPSQLAQIQARNQQLNSIQSQMNGDVVNFINSKNSALLTIQNGLPALPANNLWESSWKTILQAAVKRGQNIELSAADISALKDIANSCTTQRGIAVRSVLTYMPVEESDPYTAQEHKDNCAPQGPGKENGLKQHNHAHEEQHSELSLFPNPANTQLNVEAQAPIQTWKIFNANGMLLQQGALKDESSRRLLLDVGELNEGLYFIEVETAQGEHNTARFLKIR
jgi:hypothetical protein